MGESSVKLITGTARDRILRQELNTRGHEPFPKQKFKKSMMNQTTIHQFCDCKHYKKLYTNQLLCHNKNMVYIHKLKLKWYALPLY